MEALPYNRKCDRWHQAMKDDNIWHRRFSEGIVESETMPTRSTLAHIYGDVKAKTLGTSPSIGSAKRSACPAPRA